MQRKYPAFLATFLVLTLLLTLAGCGGPKDASQYQGRSDKRVEAHLRWYTPERLTPSARNKLAKNGVYVNENGKSVGESYRYWMEFYNNCQNNAADSLDIVTVDNEGRPKVTYLNFNGKNVLVARISDGAYHRTELKQVEDVTEGQNVWSVLSDEDIPSYASLSRKRAVMLFTQQLPLLPEYRYVGKDPYLEPICNYLTSLGTENFGSAQDTVMVPIPVILKKDVSNLARVRIWGEFWIMNYSLRGTILFNESGGEFPGMMTLERNENGYEVTSFRLAAEGENMAKSLKKICGDDRTLYHQFQTLNGDISVNPTAEIRKKFIKQYVTENGLPVTAYEDYAWDPIPIQ